MHFYSGPPMHFLSGVDRQTIVQRTKIGPELAGLLKKLGISAPKQVMAVIEPAEAPIPS
jgi:hypothetical protein